MNWSIALFANWKVFHHFLASKRIWQWLPRGRPAHDNDLELDDHDLYNNLTDDALKNILIIQIEIPRPE